MARYACIPVLLAGLVLGGGKVQAGAVQIPGTSMPPRTEVLPPPREMRSPGAEVLPSPREVRSPGEVIPGPTTAPGTVVPGPTMPPGTVVLPHGETHPHKEAAAAAGKEEKPRDSIPIGSDGINHTMERAGYPQEISHFARPAFAHGYCGYYVGGGCPCFGGPPGPQEGTYGWDYCCGPLLCHHVILGWCHGRYKGGIGAYAVEGPHVPNIFAAKLPAGTRYPCACPHGHE